MGALVGADIADPNLSIFRLLLLSFSIGILQKVVAKWKISNRKIGRLLTFQPTVVIQNGKFLNKNLKEIRYSIDNILQMLREKNVFDINEVETAIIEANGALSVLKKTHKNSVTLEDMNIVNTTSSISFPVILEGTIYSSVLKHVNLNEAWIKQQLSAQGIIDINNVFLLL